jgi:alpha-tubulin suppressor-like RCC1 family protein
MKKTVDMSHPIRSRVYYACIIGALLCVGVSFAQAASISAGHYAALYVSDPAEGSHLFGWGANGSGQLGDGTDADRLTPVKVAEDGPWLEVATNLTGVANSSLEGHSLAIKSDGTLSVWGITVL